MMMGPDVTACSDAASEARSMIRHPCMLRMRQNFGYSNNDHLQAEKRSPLLRDVWDERKPDIMCI